MFIGSGRTTFTFKYGFSTVHSDSEIAAEQQTMSYSMEAGIKFKHGSVGASMNSEHKESTARAARSTFSMNGEMEISIKCPEPVDSMSTAIGYYIFVVDSPTRTATAKQALGVCRYGDGRWNVEPECPFSACVDSQCTICRDWAAL